MKRSLSMLVISGVLLSACLPAFLEQPAAVGTTMSEEDLRGTAEVLTKQTLQALPTATIAPSQTPVVLTGTMEELSPEATETGQTQPAPALTDTPSITPSTQTSTPATGTHTLTPAGLLPASTESLHPRFYGTLPPNLPSGEITLVNKSKSEAYISLQCTTQDGYVTIIEYPVKFKVVTRVPSGKCKYVGWVGGVKMTGGFSLSSREEKTINIFKDRMEVK